MASADSLADFDRAMMRRCIALASRSAEQGEYPYGAVVCRARDVVFETINPVRRDGDVTRHAELVAVSETQRLLGRVSLDDCTLYANAEPCALCCYAIRESRIGRVVYALRAPLTGGLTRWNILADQTLSQTLPEVFAPPPEIVPCFMWQEAERALKDASPLAWRVIRARNLFGGPLPPHAEHAHRLPRNGGAREWVMALLRRSLFDRFGRRSLRG